MIKYRIIISMCCLILLSAISMYAQQKTEIVNEWPVHSEKFYQGFLTPYEGERLDFLQNLQNESVAMLVRAKDGNTFIEFEGEPMPAYVHDRVTFIWEMALAKHTGGEVSPASFSFLINGKEEFTFQSIRESDDADWKITKKDGTELAFVKSLIDKKGGDVFGYMFLTVPIKKYKPGKALRIKIIGGNHNSQDWYMAFQNVVRPSSHAQVLPALIKKDKELKQPVELTFTHLGVVTKGVIKLGGQDEKNVGIKPGENKFDLFLEPSDQMRSMQLTLTIGAKEHKFRLTQKPVRKFDVYFLPHSHIDIGFTHLQSEVEQMQWRNFEEGIALSKKTENYPIEAQYKWNVEIMWAVDSYLKNASPDKKEEFIQAVKKGWIGLDALYGSELTGLQRAEEMMHNLDAANKFERDHGFAIESAMITDVPGYSWGIVPALAQNGVKYFSIGPNHMPHLANGGYQVGNTFNAWGDIPFYWSSPSGKEKVLFWMSSHGYSWFHDWLLGTLDKSGGAPILKFLDELDEDGYPYDIVQLRYTMGDNAGPDIGMPDFIRKWNETYEYPKFRIATTQQMFEAFEMEYGENLPTYSGDFSPYWEDGAASSAVETGMNRNTADRLSQAEALYVMKNASQNFPHDVADEAWQNVLLFSEHTWGAISSKSDPDGDFAKDQWAVKQGFANTADQLADEVMAQVLPPNFSIDEYFQVVNTQSWSRSDLVIIPSASARDQIVLIDDNKKNVPIQFLENNEIAFVAENIPALGARKYRIKSARNKTIASTSEASGKLASEHLSVSLGSSGEIKELKVDFIDHDIIDQQSEFGFNEYWYTGLHGDNPQRSSNAKSELTASGPVFDEYTITSEAPGAHSLTRTIRLVKKLDRLDITNTVNKIKELKDENVHFSFPFDIPDFETKLDQAYHVLVPDKNQLKGANKNFYCAQRFVDFSNDDYGVCIANLDAPLVEFGDMHGQDWMKDMRRRPWLDKHTPSTTMFSWVMNNAWFVNYKGFQEGPITSRYRIMVHRGWDDADRKKFGMMQTQPLLFEPASKKSAILQSPFQLVGGESVLVISLKPTRDKMGYIIKLLNASDDQAQSNIKTAIPSKLNASDNKEVVGAPLEEMVKFSPWELKIIRVHPQE